MSFHESVSDYDWSRFLTGSFRDVLMEFHTRRQLKNLQLDEEIQQTGPS